MIEVRTQAELDAALAKTNNGRDEKVRLVGGGEFTVSGSSRVSAYGSSRVSAYGSSRVSAYGSSTVYASGSSTVYAYGSSTVYASGSSRVYASGSSTVYAYGSSRVYASGSSTVYAYGSSTVYAYDSSTVSAYDSSTVSATDHVAIHIKSKRAKVDGGVQITPPEPKALTVDEALQRWMIEPCPKAGTVTLYKAVCDEFKSGRGFHYPIGETVEATDWDPTPSCGGGLHLSPEPFMASRYMPEATRWLECEVAVEDLALCSTHDSFPDKAKARRLRVVREVTIGREPVEVTSHAG